MNKLIIFSALSIAVLSCVMVLGKNNKSITLSEPANPQLISPFQNWEEVDEPMVSWGCSNSRYHKNYIPELELKDELFVTGWKNERLYAQAVVWTADSIHNLSVEVSDLSCESGHTIFGGVNSYFVRNVIGDEFMGGCGYKKHSSETSHLIADCLDNSSNITMSDKSARGIWFNIDVPVDAKAGRYLSEVTILNKNDVIKKLKLKVDVINRTLPQAKDWTYHLDLWQNPYAVARINEVPLWSEEHWQYMQPLYTRLANAGQKCITATITNTPWGGQTYDAFQSMIEHKLKKDGSWEYDYTVFDNWVEFMMELGIDKQINCYSLIPWKNKLCYHDELAQKDTFMIAPASSNEFETYWRPFLLDFKEHLCDKGWFEKTSIAMDERPLKDMMIAVNLIEEIGGFKISSAANYDPEFSSHITDLSFESRYLLSDSILEDRRSKGYITTFYVCCSAEYPNNFTYSEPSEGVWQGWYAYAKNLDGFLRWAYNSWAEDPMQDTRFITWPSGDTFFVYPGNISSIRFEKLREGIQDFEKLTILMNEFKASDKPEAKIQIQKLEELLKNFEIANIPEQGTKQMILEGKRLLNNL
ncbi:DUF4091 domain-containing protein [Carboxylicivirga sp. N1Y90]|uniref:DUF4091 domain-containing protein n=1 Tax=Carboxylicivirga fragile TaxID=3417571 RepID=UPI003D32AE98|nr:DUF4091 domain-containing protein [Marinilabiliaceae bacterium N1Y90]